MAMPLIALSLFKTDVMETTLVTVMQFLPSLLFASHAGQVVQRLNKRVILVGLNILGGILSLLFLLAAYNRLIHLHLFYGYIFLMETMGVYTGVAYSSLIKVVLPQEDYGEAMHKLTVTNNLNRVIGPSVGAVIVEALGSLFALFLDGITFLLAGILQLGVKNREAQLLGRPAPQKSGGGSLYSFRLILKNPLLAPLYKSFLLGVLGLGVFQATQIYFFIEVLQISPSAMGLIFTLANGLMVLSSLAGKRLLSRLSYYRGILYYYLSNIVTMSLYFFLAARPLGRAATVLLAALGQVLALFFSPLYSIAISTIRLKELNTEDYPGVLSLWVFFTRGGVALSALAAALLVKVLGYPFLYGGLTLLFIFCSSIIHKHPSLKKYKGD